MAKTIAQLEQEKNAAWDAFAETVGRVILAIGQNKAATAAMESAQLGRDRMKYDLAQQALILARVRERVKRSVWVDDFGNDVINLTDLNAELDSLEFP